MDKPTFTNNFVINKDNNDEEVIIHFRHGYGLPKNDEKDIVIIDKNEVVHSVVMTKKNAKRLRDTLNDMLEK